VRQQLLNNDQKFSILARARSAFHLSALEATYIMSPERIRHSLQFSHQEKFLDTNANFTAICKNNANSSAIYRFLYVSDLTSYCVQPIICLDAL